jgi:gliding motility-associated-like protein
LKLVLHIYIKSVTILLCLIVSINVNGQIVTFPNQTATALTQQLVGPGIVYSNPVLTCPLNASGQFQNGLASSIQIDNGIVLTTGRVQSSGAAYGVNGFASNFANINNQTSGGDADLAASATGAINDMCKLEFDFIPTGDTIQFQYRFGSEEYPDFNCTQFNDIFAFYLSGIGYPIPTNLALVPGTNIPVIINSINDGTVGIGGLSSNCTGLGAGSPFTNLYVNNGGSATITYDGLTSLLTSKAAVTPCSTYHMKFAIADVFDHIFDSGVFLKAGSFTSDVANIKNATSSNNLSSANTFIIEGCNSSVITIARPIAKPYSQTVTYTLGGTASQTIDYTSLSGTVTIPANATTTTITLSAFADGITEGTESIYLYLNGSLCGGGSTDTLIIDVLEYPTYNIPSNATICAGQSINLNCVPNPPNSNLTFNWSPSSSLSSSSAINIVATPTATTTYTLTSLYPGCPNKSDNFTISIDPIPTLSLTKIDAACFGILNGSITANAVVGSSPASFVLQPTSALGTGTPFTFSSLGANVYTVIVSSAVGCTTSATITIAQPTPVVFGATSSTAVQCFGINNGTISTTAFGGSGILSYQLQPNGISNSTGNFTGLTSGTYTIIASDANACTASTLVTINYLTQILFNTPIVSNVSPCFGGNNGNVSLSTIGGTSPYTYTINGGSSNNNGNYSLLTANTYTVTSTDVVGCLTTSLVNITQPLQLQINNVTTSNAICFGQNNGDINTSVSGGVGGYSYLLLPTNATNNTGNFTSLFAGVYTVQVTDAVGCSATSNVTILQPNNIVFNNFTISNVSCSGGNDGQVTCGAIGGTGSFTYTIIPTSITNATGIFTGLPAANYTIVATDVNGCNTSTTFVVSQPNSFTFSTLQQTAVNCSGGNDGIINVSALGGTGVLTYTISPLPATNTTGIFNGLYAGNYTITVLDVLGCNTSTQITVTEPVLVEITGVSITNPTCINSTNGSIDVTYIGGITPFTFALNAGPFISTSLFSNLGQGFYTITVKDANGCTESTTLNLTPTNILNFGNININNVSCKFGNDGSISLVTLGGTSPYNYMINGFSNSTSGLFDTLAAGIYTILSTDAAGCTIDSSFIITEPAGVLFVANVVIANVSCKGGSNGIITFGGSGGSAPYTFKIDNGTFQNTSTFSGLTAGVHTLTIKDLAGCGNDTVVTITEPVLALTSVLKNKKPQSCIGINDAEIAVSTIGGTAPYQYLFNGTLVNADSVYSNLSPGNYSVIVTDSKGCTSSNIYIIEPSSLRPIINFSTIENPLCKGIDNGVLDWFATNTYAPYTYTFNGNYIDTLSIQTDLNNSLFTIFVTDSRGCKSDTILQLNYRTVLSTKPIATNASCEGVGNDGKITIDVTGGLDPYKYSCTNGTTNSSSNIINDLHFGTYTVYIQDAQTCKDTASVLIEFIPCCEVYVPNAFTPNNDLVNNTFGYIPHGTIEILGMEIFNRWGYKVFSSNIPYQRWDGNFKNEPAPAATYYYQIKYKCPLTNKTLIEKGDVILIR